MIWQKSSWEKKSVKHRHFSPKTQKGFTLLWAEVVNENVGLWRKCGAIGKLTKWWRPLINKQHVRTVCISGEFPREGGAWRRGTSWNWGMETWGLLRHHLAPWGCSLVIYLQWALTLPPAKWRRWQVPGDPCPERQIACQRQEAGLVQRGAEPRGRQSRAPVWVSHFCPSEFG